MNEIAGLSEAYNVYNKCKQHIGYARDLETVLQPDKKSLWDSMQTEQKLNFIIGIVLLMAVITVVAYVMLVPNKAKKLASYIDSKVIVTMALLAWTSAYHIILAFNGIDRRKLKWLNHLISLTLMLVVSFDVLELEAGQDMAYVLMGAVSVAIMITLCGWWSEHLVGGTKWAVMVLVIGYAFGATAACYELWQLRKFTFDMHYGEWNKRWLPAIITLCYMALLILIQFLNTVFVMKVADYDGLHLWSSLVFKVVFVAATVVNVHPCR